MSEWVIVCEDHKNKCNFAHKDHMNKCNFELFAHKNLQFLNKLSQISL